MKRAALLLLSLGLLSVLSLRSSESSTADHDDGEKPNETSHSMAIAQAELRLANARLARLEDANARVRNAYPAELIQALRLRKDWAEARVRELQNDPTANSFAEQLRFLRWSHASDVDRWKRAVAVHEQTAGANDRRDVEILRLRAELSRAILKQGEFVENASPIEQLEWQTAALRLQVERVRDEQISNRRRNSIRYRYFIP